jgi:hypothetical protein
MREERIPNTKMTTLKFFIVTEVAGQMIGWSNSKKTVTISDGKNSQEYTTKDFKTWDIASASWDKMVQATPEGKISLLVPEVGAPGGPLFGGGLAWRVRTQHPRLHRMYPW